MAIIHKTIMLAPPAKAIAAPAQYCVSKSTYRLSQASKCDNKMKQQNKL